MSTDTLAHVQKHWEGLRSRSPIYGWLLKDITLISATPGIITARLNVGPSHLNSKGTLHGTVSACLTDWAGGLAIASTGLEKTGVSTDIHTIYISTAKEGDELEIVGRATKVGRTLGFTTVEIVRLGEEKGEGERERVPVCNGTHTKYVKQ